MAATVGTSLQIFDSFSNVLNRFNNGLHQAITNANHLHQTLQNPLSPNLPGSNMQPAHSSPAGNIGQAIQGSLQQIIHLNQQMVSILSKQQQMATQQGQVTRNMQATHAEAGGLAETLKGVVATYLSIEAVHKAIEFMNWGDEIAGANARLSLMNDGTQTQLELQQKVMAVANNTRQAYAETAKMVAQLGSSTQGVFKSNQDVLDFTSRFNKLLVTGGANAEESKSAILQMSQALSSGVLQGDELRSLSETAPMLMKVLADGLGVARGSLKQMGADGELTSAKIVAAFAKQDAYINQLFAKMPVTFGQAMTIGKNKAAEWVATINGTNRTAAKAYPVPYEPYELKARRRVYERLHGQHTACCGRCSMVCRASE
ncbi:tape measure protein [Paenibacillus sp. TAB 01]|uniref:tape measure protein n=1 Tax=Paenibacillus sp. TAB 01 TaxID=3368988 RepID=UPI003750DDCF